jgi:hypothetical protein
MKLPDILLKIDFVKRYEKLCAEHIDFKNRMTTANKKVFDDALNKVGCVYKYFASENFYKVSDKAGEYDVNFHLVLKGGLVEPILYIEKDGVEMLPNGRLDFFSEEMNVSFDRDKYNLPIYKDEKELEVILGKLFGILSDIIGELQQLK